THVSGLRDAAQRRAFTEALVSTLGGDRPKDVQAFVVRQVQLVGGREAVPALAQLLTDEALCDDAALAPAALKGGAAEPLQAALGRATGRPRLAIIQALGVLRDRAAAETLRKLVVDPDRDTRLAAGWALANGGDAGAAELLLKAADADGYERIK